MLDIEQRSHVLPVCSLVTALTELPTPPMWKKYHKQSARNPSFGFSVRAIHKHGKIKRVTWPEYVACMGTLNMYTEFELVNLNSKTTSKTKA